MLKVYTIQPMGLTRDHEVFTLAFVVAASPWEARLVHPDTDLHWDFYLNCWADENGEAVSPATSGWVRPEKVKVAVAGPAPKNATHGQVLGANFIPL